METHPDGEMIVIVTNATCPVAVHRQVPALVAATSDPNRAATNPTKSEIEKKNASRKEMKVSIATTF